jgi:alanine racemase
MNGPLIAEIALAQNCRLVMSLPCLRRHPDHPMNRQQLDQFHLMTDQRAAFLGRDRWDAQLAEYHFDMTGRHRAIWWRPSMTPCPWPISTPVIQVRDVEVGKPSATPTRGPRDPSKIATLSVVTQMG